MDLTDTIAPNSDQLDAVDLLSGPRTFTITKVSKGNAEQPVNLHLSGFPRVWRPGKSMRRVLVSIWGPDAATYVGRRVTLYCDERVQFGGQAVGGTRISHMSHLEAAKSVPLLVTRGKSAMFRVEPLPDEPVEAVRGQVRITTKPVPRGAGLVVEAELVDDTPSAVDQLRAEWMTATPERQAEIEAEVARIEAEGAAS